LASYAYGKEVMVTNNQFLEGFFSEEKTLPKEMGDGNKKIRRRPLV